MLQFGFVVDSQLHDPQLLVLALFHIVFWCEELFSTFSVFCITSFGDCTLTQYQVPTHFFPLAEAPSFLIPLLDAFSTFLGLEGTHHYMVEWMKFFRKRTVKFRK